MKCVLSLRALSLLSCVAALGMTPAISATADKRAVAESSQKSQSVALATPAAAAAESPPEKEPRVPSFSVDYIDNSVKPGDDFYRICQRILDQEQPGACGQGAMGKFQRTG